jgi:hypothetical protein
MTKEAAMTFSVFVTSLIGQGLIMVGVIPNPLTGKPEKNLHHASSVIDTLDILKSKTAGNLTKEEDDLLNDGLYKLRMLYMDEIARLEAGSKTI